MKWGLLSSPAGWEDLDLLHHVYRLVWVTVNDPLSDPFLCFLSTSVFLWWTKIYREWKTTGSFDDKCVKKKKKFTSELARVNILKLIFTRRSMYTNKQCGVLPRINDAKAILEKAKCGFTKAQSSWWVLDWLYFIEILDRCHQSMRGTWVRSSPMNTHTHTHSDTQHQHNCLFFPFWLLRQCGLICSSRSTRSCFYSNIQSERTGEIKKAI